ncbi:hypothetical protein F2Q69_00028754 [Brassica cretica]|uniref:Uncharacterized protein n=1 Tax=Brassica cretica TaxID=69181 RepID=A0A8S9S068_BRACR|nr:hypothetical protein F2Q69_00028754 [Brassica cretica]
MYLGLQITLDTVGYGLDEVENEQLMGLRNKEKRLLQEANFDDLGSDSMARIFKGTIKASISSRTLPRLQDYSHSKGTRQPTH